MIVSPLKLPRPRLFRWELEQFLEAGLGEIAPRANRSAVAHELDDLADGRISFRESFLIATIHTIYSYK